MKTQMKMEPQIDRWTIHLHSLNTQGVWFPRALEPKPELKAWIIYQIGPDSFECHKYLGLNPKCTTWEKHSEDVLRWMYLPVDAEGVQPKETAQQLKIDLK